MQPTHAMSLPAKICSAVKNHIPQWHARNLPRLTGKTVNTAISDAQKAIKKNIRIFTATGALLGGISGLTFSLFKHFTKLQILKYSVGSALIGSMLGKACSYFAPHTVSLYTRRFRLKRSLPVLGNLLLSRETFANHRAKLNTSDPQSIFTLSNKLKSIRELQRNCVEGSPEELACLNQYLETATKLDQTKINQLENIHNYIPQLAQLKLLEELFESQ